MTRRSWKLAMLAVIVVPLFALLAIGLWPVSADYSGDEGTAGVDPRAPGLKKPFPKMVTSSTNPMSSDLKNDDRAALGRLLFFDPIVSGDNSVSCATCHHPDLGFSDGRGQSMGKGGKGEGPDRAGGAVIKRGAPSLWNAAYNHMQFWDGREPNLEEQAKKPITSADEMDANPETLVAELRAIPEYVKLFDQAFHGSNASAVTFDNVVNAIAMFERTLTANNTPFDRYVNGDLYALTPAQKRGFNVFRSGKTRCFECHGVPAFANRDFKIIGVPDIDKNTPDFGRFDVTNGEGNKGAFKIPTLRNAALNPPYMHNGKFATLEQVIAFYAAGAGPGMGNATPHLDDKIRAYSISPQEKDDLVAFLFALVDESNLPKFPEQVPSKLPVVSRIDSAQRALTAKYNTGTPAQDRVERSPSTITVKAGQSIQAVLESARPGDTILVEPGIYSEELVIDLDRITLKGVSTASPFEAARDTPSQVSGNTDTTGLKWPVLDGKMKLSDGVIATGDNFRIEGFEVRNYVANGIVVQHANAPHFRDLFVDKTGLYGTYPVSCTGVVIERVAATRIADAAIYVGQSRDIIVRDSIAFASVTGIEIENSVNALVENNYVYDNTGGILVFLLPNNVSKVGRDTRVINNRVIENNHPNFGNPTSTVGRVPPGGGILVMAADNTEVTGNEVRGNNSYGIAVTSLETAFPKGTRFDVGTTPENNWIHANRFANNGGNASESIRKLGLKGADLLWDLSGWSNRWDEPGATQATPLIRDGWPTVARRAYWRGLSVLRTMVE